MIDISTKDVSVRTAKAKGTIALGDDAFEIIKQGTCKRVTYLQQQKLQRFRP